MNQVIDDDGVGLSPEDLAALRENLEEQRRFRQEQLQQIGEASQDREEQARQQQSAPRTEVGIMLAASARMVLTDVEAALERMAQGRYGACDLCTRPISLAHLTIVPQARHCARCRQVRETGR